MEEIECRQVTLIQMLQGKSLSIQDVQAIAETDTFEKLSAYIGTLDTSLRASVESGGNLEWQGETNETNQR